jgi:putative transcriptional regulator
MLLLSRWNEPQPNMRSVFDSVYVGGNPDALERLIKQAGSHAKFRAFAGYAGWAPGQLGFEMVQGGWAVLSAESNLFDKDPASLWPDCLARLQAPRVISR